MSNISGEFQGGDSTRIDQEAADWLSRLDRGLEESEEDSFLEWLERDPRHARQLEELQQSWSICDKLGRSSLPASDAVLERSDESEIKRANPFRRIQWWIGAAAAVLALSFLSQWVLKSSGDPKAEHYFLPEGSVAQAYERHILPDGSALELNVGSQVEIRFSQERRELKLLSGEAHFIVTKNPNRPFIVDADGVEIRAVGTAFSVKLEDSSFELLVTEGRVRVEKADSIRTDTSFSDLREELVAGQKSVFQTQERSARPEIVEATVDEISQQLSWRDEIVEFVSIPMGEVVEAFNQRNFAKIVLIDKELSRTKITAAVNLSHLDSFIELLEFSANVESEITDSGTILLRSK